MSGYYWARVGGMRMAADLKRMRRAKILESRVTEIVKHEDADSGEVRTEKRSVVTKTTCAISGADCHRMAMRDA